MRAKGGNEEGLTDVVTNVWWAYCARRRPSNFPGGPPATRPFGRITGLIRNRRIDTAWQCATGATMQI